MLLHDHTRRMLALALFFLMGPMLTASVLGVIVWRQLPWSVRGHEQRIVRETGLNVAIGRVEHLHPQRVRYFDVRLLDPETRQVLLESPQLDISFVAAVNLERFKSEKPFEKMFAREGNKKNIAKESTSDAGKKKAISEGDEAGLTGMIDFFADYIPFHKPKSGYYRIVSPRFRLNVDPRLPGLGGGELKEYLFDMLTRRQGPDDAPLEFVVDALVIQTIDSRPANNGQNNIPSKDSRIGSDLTITALQGRYYSSAESTRFEAGWGFDYFPPGERVGFSAIRSRLGRTPTTHLRFFVPEEQFVPCALLAAFTPMFEQLGPECRFTGMIACDHLPGNSAETGLGGANGWDIRWEKVHLRDINLRRFAPKYTPYRITGRIEGLYIESGRFGNPGDGRSNALIEAHGVIDLYTGTIEKELFQRLRRRFGLIVKPDAFIDSFPGNNVPFDRCLIGYSLTPQGAAFTSPSPGGIIMNFRDGEMEVYMPPKSEIVPYPVLLAALMRDHTPSLPWTSETSQIMGFLPAEPTPPTGEFATPTSIPSGSPDDLP